MARRRTVYVCRGTGCVSGGGSAVYDAIAAELEQQGVTTAEVDFTGCHGFCQQGPNVVVEPDGIFYTHVTPEDAPGAFVCLCVCVFVCLCVSV